MKLLLFTLLFPLLTFAGIIEDFQKITPVGSWTTYAKYEKPIAEGSKYNKISETTYILEKFETDGIRKFFWIEIQTQEFTGEKKKTYTLVKADAERLAKLFMKNISFFTDQSPIFAVPDIAVEVYSSYNGVNYIKENALDKRAWNDQWEVIITSVKSEPENMTITKGKTILTTKHSYTTDTINKPGKATLKLLKKLDIDKKKQEAQKRALKRKHILFFTDVYPFRFIKSIESHINNPHVNVLFKAGIDKSKIPDQRKNIVTNLLKFGKTGKKSVVMQLLQGKKPTGL